MNFSIFVRLLVGIPIMIAVSVLLFDCIYRLALQFGNKNDRLIFLVVGIGYLTIIQSLVVGLGMIGLLSPLSVITVIFFLWLSLRHLPRPNYLSFSIKLKSTNIQIAVIISAVIVGVKLLLALWRFPSGGDTLMYHLPNAVEWLKSGTVLDRDMMLWYQPGAGESLAWWLMAFISHDTLVSIANFLILPLGWLALSALTSHTNKRITAFAYPIFICSPLVLAQQLGTNNNDLLMTMYFVSSLTLVKKGKLRIDHCLTAGLATGLVSACRYTGLAWASILIMAATLRYRNKIFIGWFLTGVIITGLPWYARNFLLTGNALYPLGQAGKNVVHGSGANLFQWFKTSAVGAIILHPITGIKLFFLALMRRGGFVAFVLPITAILHYRRKGWVIDRWIMIAGFGVFLCTPLLAASNGLADGWKIRFGLPVILLSHIVLIHHLPRRLIKPIGILLVGSNLLFWNLKAGLIILIIAAFIAGYLHYSRIVFHSRSIFKATIITFPIAILIFAVISSIHESSRAEWYDLYQAINYQKNAASFNLNKYGMTNAVYKTGLQTVILTSGLFYPYGLERLYKPAKLIQYPPMSTVETYKTAKKFGAQIIILSNELMAGDQVPPLLKQQNIEEYRQIYYDGFNQVMIYTFP